MPSESFRATATATASPADAWAALQRPETWEGIAGVDHVSHPVHDANGRLTGFTFAATVAGMQYPGESTVTVAEPPGHMRVELTTSELAATIDVRLRQADSSSHVRVDLSIHSRSFLAGMFFSSIAAAIGRGLPRAAEEFAQRLSAPV